MEAASHNFLVGSPNYREVESMVFWHITTLTTLTALPVQQRRTKNPCLTQSRRHTRALSQPTDTNPVAELHDGGLAVSG
jgi:hypothetical protein